MDPEVQTMLNNAIAILEQLKAGGAGAEAPAPEEAGAPESEDFAASIARALKELENEGSPEDKKEDEAEAMKGVKKDVVAGKPDASVGSSDAKEIIEDQPEWNEKNVAEVAKAVIKAMAAKKAVRKSSSEEMVAKAIEAIAGQVVEQGKAISGLLNELGFAQKVEKSIEAKAAAAPERRPIQADNSEVMKALELIAKQYAPGSPDSEAKPDPHAISKSLTADGGALLTGLFGKK